jgi:hypothetical protein
MATIFPLSASVGQEFQGYMYDGTIWNLVGNEYNPTTFSSNPPDNPKPGDLWVDSVSEVDILNDTNIASISDLNNYLTISSASTTYATKEELENIDLSSASAAAVAAIVDSAPSTLNTLNELAAALNDDANFSATVTTAIGNKLDISTASATYLTQLSASTTYAAKSGETFSGNITAPEVRASTKLVAQTVGGDEGGEILLGKAATNTTLSGDGVTIDVWQNRLRIFEQGGDARGGYIDVSTLGNGVSTNLTPGMVLLNTTTLTASSGVQLNNIFSSTYDQYFMSWTGTCTNNGESLNIRFSSGGTPNTSTLYFSAGYYVTHIGGPSRHYTSSQNVAFFGNVGDISGSIFNYINNPFLASPTNGSYSFNMWGTNANYIGQGGFSHNNPVSYDGAYIYPSGGTLTGTLKFYGIKK